MVSRKAGITQKVMSLIEFPMTYNLSHSDPPSRNSSALKPLAQPHSTPHLLLCNLPLDLLDLSLMSCLSDDLMGFSGPS